MTAVTILQPAAPPYRTPLFESLLDACELRLLCPPSVPGTPSIGTDDRVMKSAYWQDSKAVALLGGRVYAHRRWTTAVYASEAVVAELNPRAITSWILVVMRNC